MKILAIRGKALKRAIDIGLKKNGITIVIPKELTKVAREVFKREIEE